LRATPLLVTALDLASSAGQFVLRFVQESNAIEDVSIPDAALITGWEQGAGHMGAARRMLDLAEGGDPLSIDHVCAWQAAITREQLSYGHWIADQHIGCLRKQHMGIGQRPFAAPDAIELELGRILEQINTTPAAASWQRVLELAARTHWRFELIHPFADGNGRAGRLLALYLLRLARVPPVLFIAGDRDSRYYRAFDPAGAGIMIQYFQEHQLRADPWT